MQRIWSRIGLLPVFSLVSLLGMLVIGSSLARLVGQAIENTATGRARTELTDVVRTRHPFWLDLPPAALRSVHTTPAEVAAWQARGIPAAGDYQWWHDQITTTLAGLPIYQIKIWSPEARIIWSDQPQRVGEWHPDDPNVAAALTGEVQTSFAFLRDHEPEEAVVPDIRVMALYVPLLGRDRLDVIGVFEVYEAVDDLYEDIQAEQQAVWTGVAISLAGLYLLLVGLVAQAAGTIRRLDRLRELERYFSPAVARVIARHPARLFAGRGGAGARPPFADRLMSTGELTVVFVDIRDFTRTSEQLPPEMVIHMLDDYLGVVTRAVFSHGGSVDKFLGDGVLAIFGAPLPDPDHARQAVWAVQQVFRDIAALNEARLSLGQPPIHIGAAVVTGPAISGNIGSPQQLSFTVIGDTVNLGARLVGLAAPGEVLVSRATVEQLPQGDDGAALGPGWRISAPRTLLVRGRAAPAEVYSLSPAASPVPVEV
jgi:class 3 adenylate cyclase